MKKIFLTILIGLFASHFIYSQYVENALRFSSNNYGGTARFVGMGGAFGALGGDFSSISINPAGLGVYRGSEFTFSPGMSFSNNSSTYINNTLDDTKYSMNLNNVGFVASYNLENTDTRWINANFGIGYNRINNFNNNIIFEGVNNSSLMEVFVNYANLTATPETADNLDGMYEYLLWDTYLLDSAGGVFYNEIDDEAYNNPNFGINQRKIIKTEGSANEFNFAFGGNYANKLYIGVSIGVAWIDLTEYSSHYEYETAAVPIPFVHGFNFIENSKTTGTGFNFKFGAIYKPVEFLRVGASFHTPTFYNLDQEFYNKAIGYFDDGDVLDSRSVTQKYNYQLQTPLRAIGSVAFQIGKMGLIDFDYEYADYSSMKLSDDLNSQGVIDDNATMESIYRATHNIRVGGELRLGAVYFRAGGGYSTSPYTSSTINKDYNRITFSGGLGYRVKHMFVDFAFAQTNADYKMSAYDWQYNNALASINNKMNNFIMTFGLKF